MRLKKEENLLKLKGKIIEKVKFIGKIWLFMSDSPVKKYELAGG